VDTRKQQFGPTDLDTLLAGASKVVVARGKKAVDFFPSRKDHDPAAFLKTALGPTGNLRAPAAKVGRTWLIGFNEDAWIDALT